MKDWVGNKNSIFKTLGASNHTDKEREENDFYATDPIAIDKLLGTGFELSKNVWEPACGAGHLSKRLEHYGYNVRSTDLIDRGYLAIEKYVDIKEKIFKNKEIILRKTEKKTDDLMKFEKFIIEWFIDKYGDAKKVSMQEIENRLKKNFDEESPSDLFEHWIGLVFLSFPLKKFYKEYRGNNNKAYVMYIVFIILGIVPIFPFVRNFRNIWIRVYIVCLPNISIK